MTSSGRRHHGDLEAAVLRAVWAAGGPVSAGEVRDRLGDREAYTTILTVLTRLHDKGMLTRERVGKSHRFSAVVDEAAMTSGQMEAQLRLANDQRAVLSKFVETLEPEEADFLRRLLTDRTGEEP